MAGGVAAVVCAIVLDERDLLRVGLLAITLPIVAFAFTALQRVQLSADHHITPEQVMPGSRGRVTLIITNTSRTRTPAVEISEPPTPGLTAGMRYLVAPIRRGEQALVHYGFVAARRGHFTLGPPSVRVYDPFDLWEDNSALNGQTDILVVPAVVALSGMPSSTGSMSAASGRSNVGTMGGDPDVGVRPYRSGDDIRTIHWRASARQEELVVRLNEPVSHGGVAVLLDHRQAAHQGADINSSLETAVILAASIVLHLMAADHQVTLMSHRASLITDGHSIADDVLAKLAVLQADPNPAISPISTGKAGLLVAVLGDMDAAQARTLAASRRRSVNAVALVLQTSDWAPGGGQSRDEVPPAASILGAAGWRVAVVRGGDDLGLAWRRACASGDFARDFQRIS